jgi:hypothetical protein
LLREEEYMSSKELYTEVFIAYSANLWDELLWEEEYMSLKELYTWLQAEVFIALQCKSVG